MLQIVDKVANLENDLDCLMPRVERYKIDLYKRVRLYQDVSSAEYYEAKRICIDAIRAKLNLEETISIERIRARCAKRASKLRTNEFGTNEFGTNELVTNDLGEGFD